MADTPDHPVLSFAKPAGGSSKKTYYLFGEKNDQSPVLAAVRAGFAHLGLQHEFLAQSTSNPDQIEEEVREDKVSGAIVPLSLSGKLVLEAEYVDESLEEIGSVNVVTKDDFKDLHIANTYKTILTSLILANMPSNGEAKALVLGTTAISKTASFILQELGISFSTWDTQEPYSFDLATFDFAGISHIISGLGNVSGASIPESALGPDTLVIDSHTGETDTPLVSAAKTAKSVLFTGVELEFEALLLAFQAIVSPIGVPLAVPAPSNVMAKAFVEASSPTFQQSVPQMIAKHL